MDEGALEELLGRAGEDCLRKLTRTGFLVNPALKDAKGWDFLVEEVNDHDVLELPLVAPRPRIMMVQCKGFAVYPSDTSKTVKTRRQIQMQHWMRSVTDPMPWFYLIVEVNAEADFEPLGAYLVHIGKKWIDRLTKRAFQDLREKGGLTLEGKMDLRWEASERLPDLSPSTFKAVIAQYLGVDMDRYALQKMLARKRAGFEGYSLKIGLPQEGDEKALADYLLGYVPLTTLERYLEEHRFGEPRTLMNLGPGPIPSIGAAIAVRIEGPHDSMRLEGAAFSSSQMTEMRTEDGQLRYPGHKEAVRVVAEPFEFINVSGDTKVVISAVRPDGQVSLRAAADAHRLMQIFGQPETERTVRLVLEDRRARHLEFVDEHIDRALAAAQKGLQQMAGLVAALGGSTDQDEDERPMAESAIGFTFGAATPRSRDDERKIWLLSDRFERIWKAISPAVQCPDIRCHFGDLLDQQEEIMMLATLLGIETKALVVTLSSDQKFKLPDSPWIPTAMGLQLGGYRLWAAGFIQTATRAQENPDGKHAYTLEHVGGDYIMGGSGPAAAISAAVFSAAAERLRAERTRHAVIIEPDPSMWMATDFPSPEPVRLQDPVGGE